MMAKSEAIKNAFATAAQVYQNKADVQYRVAGQLAKMVATYELPARPHILEIGCGTGFLSQHLVDVWPDATLLCSDIAPEMVASCRANLVDVDDELVSFAVMDGENLPKGEKFDLIVSSLVFQWFVDPLGNLANLVDRLNPGGRLAFVTLGEETFKEWRGLCDKNRIACGLHDYPTRDDWQSCWPDDGAGEMDTSMIIEEHPSPLAFLKGLKEIGTGLPVTGHAPVSGGELRRVLAGYVRDKSSFCVTYHLLFGSFLKNL
ncbi:MAG: methyltransferase domain-containing protein [Magnetococcales bacterium]|nr:methyltransferase domain-containing protein [Magnetococcales bacterium]